MNLLFTLEEKESIRNVFKEYHKCYENLMKMVYERENLGDMSPSEETVHKNNLLFAHLKEVKKLLLEFESTCSEMRTTNLTYVRDVLDDMLDEHEIMLNMEFEDMDEDGIMKRINELVEQKNWVLDEI